MGVALLLNKLESTLHKDSIENDIVFVEEKIFQFSHRFSTVESLQFMVAQFSWNSLVPVPLIHEFTSSTKW